MENEEFHSVVIGGFEFRWHGGAYVDVSYCEAPDSAFDCINVWDYETNTCQITLDLLPEVAMEWISENLPDWRNSGALADHIAYAVRHDR